MQSNEIRKKFLEFFEKRGHAIVPSSSLIPDDPSVLLTTAGMQQFKKYYTGELDAVKDFGSKNAVSVQKCFRTSDIDEVGDETHLTFFEMLGNFSFGGYWKKEAITYAYDFIVKTMGLKISYVTVFHGKDEIGVPKDDESKKIWKSLDPNLVIKEEGMEDVFWGPTGASGPCGPTTEIYCKSADGKDVEIWNIVFNEFFCKGSREELLAGTASLEPLKTKGIDTGMGLERLAMISQGKKNIFETDLFTPIIRLLSSELPIGIRRRITDHLRGSIFLIADGTRPTNKEAGYVLRRLMRRIFVYEHIFSISSRIVSEIIQAIISEYGVFYSQLRQESNYILEEFGKEQKKFQSVLPAGIRKINQLIKEKEMDSKTQFAQIERADATLSERSINVISGREAFDVYQSLGLPQEVIEALLADKGYTYDKEEFKIAFKEAQKKHQELSRAGAEKKFGGHGLVLDTGELKAGSEEDMKKVLRLHTATHLLQAALREVLGDDVHQAGSDITPERTRFDFSFSRKMTPEEIQKTEHIVNEKIKEDLPVQFKEMSKAEAEKIGALHFFKEKYPDPVKVYYIGRDLALAWSKEFCGGPHVAHTGEIGKVKIVKEEAVSAGVRRIRAIVE
jgi:alanyl-tRNA synthetase